MHNAAKCRLALFLVGMVSVLILAGCGAPAATTTAPTSAPATLEVTAEPTLEATATVAEPTSEPTLTPTQFVHPATQSLNIIYQTADNLLMGYITGTGDTWNFGGSNFPIIPGPHSTIARFDTNIYVVGGPSGEPPQVYEITPVGVRPIYQNPPATPNGIAVTHDPADPAHPLMAVGEEDFTQSPPVSRLLLLWIDSPTALQVTEQSSPEGNYLTPWRWSADAQRLYFSQEPTGLGGYILFDGYSTLSVFDRGTGAITELISPEQAGGAICLDDISPDEHLVANHCTPNSGIGLYDLQTQSQTTVISAPPDIAGEVGSVGSAVFSPDGSRLAFALARQNPDNEQGWVAVTDDLAGASRLVMTSEPGMYLVVAGWADAQTLVVKSYAQNGETAVWLVPTDGGEPKQIGVGQYLTMIPPAQ